MRSKKTYYFRDVARAWMELNKTKIKGSTEAKYTFLLDRHILPEIGSFELSELSSQILSGFIKRKMDSGKLNGGGGLSPPYVKTMIVLVSSILKYAEEEYSCRHIKIPVVKLAHIHKAPSVFDRDDQLKLIAFLTESITTTKLGILISLYTGMRIGEVCALKWEDIDFDNKIIHVKSTISRIVEKGPHEKPTTRLIINSPKTNTSYRDIPLSDNLISYMKKIRNKNNAKFVISTSKNEFVSPRTYEYRYHKILRQSHLPPLNYHSLRHTFATRCIEAGVDIKTLSEILGHANVSITLNIYVHSSIELKRLQLKRLDEYLR